MCLRQTTDGCTRSETEALEWNLWVAPCVSGDRSLAVFEGQGLKAVLPSSSTCLLGAHQVQQSKELAAHKAAFSLESWFLLKWTLKFSILFVFKAYIWVTVWACMCILSLCTCSALPQRSPGGACSPTTHSSGLLSTALCLHEQERNTCCFCWDPLVRSFLSLASYLLLKSTVATLAMPLRATRFLPLTWALPLSEWSFEVSRPL